LKTVVLAALLLLTPLIANAGGRHYTNSQIVTHSIDTLVDTTDGLGNSEASGEIGLFAMVRWQSMTGMIIIEPSGEDTLGYGLSDSGYVYLRTRLGASEYTIGQDSAAELPCTLYVAISELVGDTLLKEALFVDWVIQDSLSHVDAEGLTTFTHRVIWNFIVRD